MAKKPKTRRISWAARIFANSKARQQEAGPSPLAGALKVLAAACMLAALAAGVVFLERYVKTARAASRKTFALELIGVPVWVSDELKEKVYMAARDGRDSAQLDRNAAANVQQSVEPNIHWIDRVKVQTLPDRIRLEGRWRKPLALVKWGADKFYVDVDSVVLDFVPMPHLPIVEVKGLSQPKTMPPAGRIWRRDDLAAALAVLGALERMDARVTPDRPLLYEIESIDVSNFKGRKKSGSPHIVLYAKDNTQIIWGVEMDAWARYLEATDADKLAKLYGHYKQFGSLLNGAKYINLSEPQDKIPLPIDKY